ncbi:aldehyde dehydrogenase [Xanthobacter flavus]|uniref:aldehyde dehydrogenase n=1 Tax=Xanthobacter flavus TaxID=281 RepID=UPI00372A2639
MYVRSKEIETLSLYIDGRSRPSGTGTYFDSNDPYTGGVWSRVPIASAEDVDQAVKAAHRAFTTGPWAEMTPTRRGRLLHRLGDLVAAHAEKLGELEVRDNGKLLAEMLGQMRYLPEWFYYYGGLADKIEGSVTPGERPGMMHYIRYEPIGVVAAISPWNSPLVLTAWKLAPALAAGNTVVVKPSEYSSASMLYLARLFEEAGFPPGVVNVVTGGGKVGEALVNHPLVERIAFTGGEAGGRAVYQAAAKAFKRVSLELGGKSPNIVFEDADLDDAVKGAVAGVFAAAGQTCMAGSRLLVQDSIHDEFVERLVAFAECARLGDPMHDDTDIGPIATRPQFQKILDYIEIAKAEGAQCVLGGGRAEGPGLEGGHFVRPTIFTGVTNRMRIAQEEVFGPVVSVIRFKTEEEAVEIANDTLYGLAAGVWTQSLDRAINLPARLRAGTVWVNAYRVVSYLAPFGGFKNSGIGRENGKDAIREYLEAKSVFLNTRRGVPSPFVMRLPSVEAQVSRSS